MKNDIADKEHLKKDGKLHLETRSTEKLQKAARAFENMEQWKKTKIVLNWNAPKSKKD